MQIRFSRPKIKTAIVLKTSKTSSLTKAHAQRKIRQHGSWIKSRMTTISIESHVVMQIRFSRPKTKTAIVLKTSKTSSLTKAHAQRKIRQHGSWIKSRMTIISIESHVVMQIRFSRPKTKTAIVLKTSKTNFLTKHTFNGKYVNMDPGLNPG